MRYSPVRLLTLHRDRSFYIGTVGAVWACASALGPVLSGIFAQYTSWRWCFFVNGTSSSTDQSLQTITHLPTVPIICISIVTLFFSLTLHYPRTPLLLGVRSLDWLGATTILAASTLLLVGLQLGANSTFVAPMIISFIVLASLLTISFPITQVLAERSGRDPILPLRIFKDTSNLSAVTVCAADALAFNSVAYFLPMYFQVVLNLSPAISGAYMLAIAVPLAIVCLASGYLIERTGRFLEVLQAGLLTMTVGIGLLIFLNASHDIGKIVVLLVIVGLGFGPNFGAPLIALQTRIRPSDIATGTSAFGFVRMISGAIGVVAGQVVFQLLMAKNLEGFMSAGIPQDLADRLASEEALSLASRIATLPEQQKLVAKAGLSSALRGTWIFNTAVSALGLLVSFGIKRTKLQRASECATKLESLSDEVGRSCSSTTTDMAEY